MKITINYDVCIDDSLPSNLNQSKWMEAIENEIREEINICSNLKNADVEIKMNFGDSRWWSLQISNEELSATEEQLLEYEFNKTLERLESRLWDKIGSDDFLYE